jgi:AraC-like DNA-binding protein
MSHASVPLFQTAGTVYKADSCLPLKAAHRTGALHLHAVGRGDYPGDRIRSRMLPGLCSLGVWDAPTGQDWGLDWHRNEGIEIALLDRGECPFATGAVSCGLRAGQLTITRPWQPHRLGDPCVPASRLGWMILDVGVRRPNQRWVWPEWLCLPEGDLAALTRLLRGSENPVLDASRPLRGAFNRLLQILEDRARPHFYSRVAVGINEVLVWVLDLLERSPLPLDRDLSSTARTVRLFIDEIRNHPGQQARAWSVEQMAESCGVKAHRFSELVREQTNHSPARYLNECRLETARRLLRETDARIARVARDCGFGSSQYFSMVFRSATGMSPKAWREQG